MALHDPDTDLQYDAAVDRLTREKAFMILAALKAGHPNNVLAMFLDVSDYLSDSQALETLIRQSAQGRNAFGELLQQLALVEGERQARTELADAPAHRREQARLDQFAPVPI